MNDFTKARLKETAYHEQFYSETALFQPGSWLSRPVQVVLDTLKLLDQPNLQALDLGCGVGRNSIPIAGHLKARNGRLTCIDILPTAIQLLVNNAKQYEVDDVIVPLVADVEAYRIERDTFDYIVACCCLEHVSSEETLAVKLREMRDGTKTDGLNCIQMCTDVKEIDVDTGIEQEALIELNLPAEKVVAVMNDSYCEWKILTVDQRIQQVNEVKDRKPIIFRANLITFVAQKMLI